MLCWAAKWSDQKTVLFDSVHASKPEKMVKGIHKLLDEADAVVHYNGKRFDIPVIQREMLLQGLPPPSPYRQIDLLNTARRQFKFASNKLQYVAKALGIGEKTMHTGFDLWIGAMEGDEKSWKLMEKYNKQDVILLERLYKELLPWVKGLPNAGLYEGLEEACPACGSDSLQRRGFAHTVAFRFQRYQCQSCGSWSRSAATEKPTNRNKLVAA